MQFISGLNSIVTENLSISSSSISIGSTCSNYSLKNLENIESLCHTPNTTQATQETMQWRNLVTQDQRNGLVHKV